MTVVEKTAPSVSKNAGIKILGNSVDNRYPLAPLFDIRVVERPVEGQESTQLFFNPRDIESMDSENMRSLRTSIAQTGLHTPLIVRAITENSEDDGIIIRLDLVAGERRLRSLLCLHESNEPVYDWRTKTFRPAQEVWDFVPCEILYNISDEEALALAWMENFERQNLTIQEEINLVDRLLKRGMNQEEIAKSLKSNVTWVSQTHSFRKELPAEAFELLVQGRLSRHVAVKILSYNKADRDVLVRETIQVEVAERTEALKQVNREIEQAEDEEVVAIAKARKQPALRKKIAAAARKVQTAKDKKDRVESEAGTIRQGHLHRGALQAQVLPRKAKMLTRGMIEQFLVDLPSVWRQNEKVDPLVHLPYPSILLDTIVATAKAVLTGNADTASIVRKVMVQSGEWELPEGTAEKPAELLDIEEGDEEIEEVEV
jgi:ParB-like chromosome segregation protein Spo0J